MMSVFTRTRTTVLLLTKRTATLVLVLADCSQQCLYSCCRERSIRSPRKIQTDGRRHTNANDGGHMSIVGRKDKREDRQPRRRRSTIFRFVMD